MTSTLRLATLAATLSVLGACATAPKKDLSKFVSASPRAILVVPVVNKSVDVDAADYFLSTVSIPLAERGYYVFPVNMVKRLLEDDGLSDAMLVHNADPARVCGLFGADAVLFITIQRWDAKYMVFATQVTVGLEYVLKDGRTGETLWEDSEQMVYTPQSSGGGGLGSLIAAAITAAVEKAAPSYMPLARQANTNALMYPGPGFPSGPYHPEYKKDFP